MESTMTQFADEEANLTKELHALQAQYRELQHSSDKQSIALTSKEREATRLKDEKVRRQSHGYWSLLYDAWVLHHRHH